MTRYDCIEFYVACVADVMQVVLTWAAPLAPNGELLDYIVYRDGGVAAAAGGTQYTLHGLAPNMEYSVRCATIVCVPFPVIC